MDTIETLDNLQYHLYAEESTLLNSQTGLDYRFRDELTHASVINGEYGTRNAADTPFDMQRNAIWNGIMTRVPRYMWIWEHYLDPSWAGLFSMPAQYLEDEDLAMEKKLEDHAPHVLHSDKQLRSLGLSGDSIFYGYIYDPGNGMNITGATLTIDNLPIANYSISYYLPVSGEVIENDSIALIEGTHILDLPIFSKGIAFKVKFHSDYILPLANAGNDTVVAVATPAIVTGKLSSSPVSGSLTYQWSLEEKPEGSAVNIADSTAMEFEIVPDMAGSYRFSLVVGDGQNKSVPDQVMVRGSLPPVAIAPSDTTVAIKETYVRLNGSGSYDPDGDQLLYSWILLSAPEESEKLMYEENSHEVILKTDAEGVFVVELTVSDGVSESQPDTVNVTVVSNGTGLANHGSAEDFNFFPNPTSGKLLISSSNNDQVEKIEIIDLNGQIDKDETHPLTYSYRNYHGEVKRLWNGYHKPAIIPETGWDHTFYEMSMPGYQAQFHNAMWVCLASGAAMSPFWWSYSGSLNDNVVTNQLLSIRRFADGIPFSKLTGLSPASISNPGGDAYAIASDQLIFGWAVNADTDMSGKSITLSGIDKGAYRLRLYHTWRGRFLDEEGHGRRQPDAERPPTGTLLQASNNTLTFEIPILKIEDGHARYIGQDVAFTLEPVE